jgi:lipooligosaccharide transport system ATP-binding protein
MSGTYVAIVAKNLIKKFGNFTAVNNISFTINKGECFGFLGPNGAGKTTTIRMITCTSPKTAGILKVFNLDVDKDARQIKSILGVVPQENNLDPDFTCFENLIVYSRYFGISKKIAKEKAKKLLKFIDLEKRANTIIEHLSTGMKRRLVIARALLNNPQILVLDEPTTGLDPQARHLIWSKIRELKSKGLTVLLTTHYMDEAAQLCDRLVIMDNGRIIAEGTPTQLVSQYAGREVIEISMPPADLHFAMEYMHKIGVKYEQFDGRMCIFTEDSNILYQELASKFKLTSCTIRMANLEDVFLKLTGRKLRD